MTFLKSKPAILIFLILTIATGFAFMESNKTHLSISPPPERFDIIAKVLDSIKNPFKNTDVDGVNKCAELFKAKIIQDSTHTFKVGDTILIGITIAFGVELKDVFKDSVYQFSICTTKECNTRTLVAYTSIEDTGKQSFIVEKYRLYK